MNLPILFRKDDESLGAARIPTRAEISASDTWDLAILYGAPSDWNDDFAYLQHQFPRYGEFKGRIGQSASNLRDCLEFDKDLSQRVERLNHYASLRMSEDSSDAENLKREAQLQNLLTKVAEASSYLSPEIQAIDDPTFDAFLADPVLAEWRIALRKIRRLRPHTLSEPEERLLALGASAIYGHHETFSQLTNVDMKFGVIADEKGVERALSQSSFSSFMVKRDPAVRKKRLPPVLRRVSRPRVHARLIARALRPRGCLLRPRPALLRVRAPPRSSGTMCRRPFMTT